MDEVVSFEQARSLLFQQEILSFSELLRARPSLLDATDHSGYSLLHFACFLGFTELVALLYDRGANPLKPDLEGFSPLQLAADKGQMQCLAAFQKAGLSFDLNSRPPTAHTRRGPLAEAIKRGDLGSATILMQMGFKGSPPTDQADFAWSELFRFSRRPYWGVSPPTFPSHDPHTLFDAFARLFIDNGLGIDLVDHRGNGLAIFAALYCNDIALRWLAGHGADLNLANHHGISPLWASCEDGKEVSVRLLLELGADGTLLGPEGESCQHVALRHGHFLIASLMEAYDLESLLEKPFTESTHPLISSLSSHPLAEKLSEKNAPPKLADFRIADFDSDDDGDGQSGSMGGHGGRSRSKAL